jgi:tryptophan halogenase
LALTATQPGQQRRSDRGTQSSGDHTVVLEAEGKPEPLWKHCRAMPLPESLIYKEEHFSRTGRIVLSSDELFKEASWFAVLVGQGHEPKDYNPLIDSVSSEDNLAHLRRIKENIRMIAARMRDHLSFLS